MPGVHSKRQLNVRVSDEAHAILAKLCEHLGVSQAAALEFVLREKARSEGWRLRDLVDRYMRALA